MRRLSWVIVFLLALGGGRTLYGHEQQLTAEEIIKKVINLPQGSDFKAVIQMRLANYDGKTRKQAVKIWRKEGENKGQSKILVIFTDPANLRGTSFLTLNKNKPQEDIQSLYLPALRKSRRISFSNQGGSFVGTEFTYYDLQERELEEYSYKLLKKEKYENYNCYVIESIPNGGSPYSKTIQWIREDFFPIRIDFYDKKEKLLKRLTISNLTVIDGILIGQELTMQNLQSGRATYWTVSDINFNTGLSEEIFTERSFEVHPE